MNYSKLAVACLDFLEGELNEISFKKLCDEYIKEHANKKEAEKDIELALHSARQMWQ